MRQGIGFLFFLGLTISMKMTSPPRPGADQEDLLQMMTGIYRMKKSMELTPYTWPRVLELKPIRYTRITRTKKLTPPETKKPKEEKKNENPKRIIIALTEGEADWEL